jgi:tyrosinase
MARRSTYDTRTTLLYRYQNELMPTKIPLAQAGSAKLFMARATQPQLARVFKVQATPQNILGSMPPVGSFKLSPPRATTDTAFSVGGALGLALDRRSTAFEVPLSSDAWQAVQAIMARKPATIANSAKTFRSLHIVLDNVELSEIGKNGGYYYQIYLNFASPDGRSSTQPALIGTLGAFQINGAAHHGQGPVRLDYLIDPGSVQSSPLRGGVVSVSLVRVDGDNSPTGQVINLGEARLELSTDDQGP